MAKKLGDVTAALNVKAEKDTAHQQNASNVAILSMSGSATSKPNYSDKSASAAPAKPIVVKSINAQEIKTFLEHIVWGRQDEAEVMLKANKELALASGDITDHANRTFKNITGFQYAVWALDWKMWTMLLPYLPNDKAAEQAKGFTEGSWLKEHGEHATWNILTDALQTFIDNFSQWNNDSFTKHWIEVFGGLQSDLPMHVLQEYNNPNRPFKTNSNFSTLYSLVRELPDWLGQRLGLGKQFDFGIFRGSYEHGQQLNGSVVYLVSMLGGSLKADLHGDMTALTTLYDTRVQQRSQLIATLLGNKLSQAQKAKGK